MLEVGIGGYRDPESGGNSLRMWRNYFPRATVYGLDIYPKSFDDDRKIVALQADQSDQDSLRRAVAACPPFDLIIDDGSHIGSHIVTAFAALFPALAPTGLYVIEDLEYAYMPDYGGGLPGAGDTALELLKALLDDLNLGPRPIASIHVYPGIAFIQKAITPSPTPARIAALPGLADVSGLKS
jgi:hypothetical protein